MTDLVLSAPSRNETKFNQNTTKIFVKDAFADDATRPLHGEVLEVLCRPRQRKAGGTTRRLTFASIATPSNQGSNINSKMLKTNFKNTECVQKKQEI